MIIDYHSQCDVESNAKAKGTIYGLDLALGWGLVGEEIEVESNQKTESVVSGY